MAYDEVRGTSGDDQYKDAPVLKLTKHGDGYEGTVLEISREFTGQYGPLRVIVLKQDNGNVVKLFASKVFLERVNEADPRPGDRIKGEREDRTGKESGRMYVSHRFWIDRQSGAVYQSTPETQAPPREAAPAGPVGDDAPPF